MYATTRRYEGVTDPGEAGRRVNEGFVPLISKMPGFVAYYWADAGNGVMVSTSVFQPGPVPSMNARLAAESDWRSCGTFTKAARQSTNTLRRGVIMAEHSIRF